MCHRRLSRRSVMLLPVSRGTRENKALAQQRYLQGARDRTRHIFSKHYVFSWEIAKRTHAAYAASCRAWLAARAMIVMMAAYMATQRYKDLVGELHPESNKLRHRTLAGKAYMVLIGCTRWLYGQ